MEPDRILRNTTPVTDLVSLPGIGEQQLVHKMVSGPLIEASGYIGTPLLRVRTYEMFPPIFMCRELS